MTTAPDRGRREDLLLQKERGAERKENDDDGVLNNGRKAIGQPIDAPRIDQHGDQRVDDAEDEQQRLNRRDLLLHVRRISPPCRIAAASSA